MPRDAGTRPCRDCGEQKTAYEWCDACGAYVCDDCNDGHNCVGDALPDQDFDGEDDCPPAHAPDCDDPACEGECMDSEDDDCC